MQSVQRCYTHMFCHLSNKEPQENVQCQPIIWYKITFKASAQVLLISFACCFEWLSHEQGFPQWVTLCNHCYRIYRIMPVLRLAQNHRASHFQFKYCDHLVIETYQRTNHWQLRSSLSCCLKKTEPYGHKLQILIYTYTNLKMNGGSKTSVFFWCYHLLRCFGGNSAIAQAMICHRGFTTIFAGFQGPPNDGHRGGKVLQDVVSILDDCLKVLGTSLSQSGGKA